MSKIVFGYNRNSWNVLLIWIIKISSAIKRADNADVVDVLRFLREREVVHFQRFGEALRNVQEKLAQKKFYMNNNCLMTNMNDSTVNNTVNNMTANLSNDNMMNNNCSCNRQLNLLEDQL